jgi:hypothetical protein
MHYFHVFKLLGPPKICWHCILNEGYSFTKIWASVSPTYLIGKLASHSTYLLEFFAQPWRKIEIHVVLSGILIFLQAKFSQFYPSCALFYQKKTPSLLVSIITKSKIFLDTNFSFEDRKRNEIWRVYWVAAILTIHLNALFAFISVSQTLKIMLILYCIVG